MIGSVAILTTTYLGPDVEDMVQVSQRVVVRTSVRWGLGHDKDSARRVSINSMLARAIQDELVLG
jgi:hypothetical protein